eukprot:TRINITY_DN29106_c0_g1_i1.p2 TRINITY_DN29106_c0_g1~~TRINITY_DN29106_c0_g1_i1.p2  ORF type:complete len:163 (-),score=23.75 TRINITY_DN29106_c0_g1_i1:190-678(-)
MVWDLSLGPKKMDYSHLNPNGRKSVKPQAATRRMATLSDKYNYSPVHRASVASERSRSMPLWRRRSGHEVDDLPRETLAPCGASGEFHMAPDASAQLGRARSKGAVCRKRAELIEQMRRAAPAQELQFSPPLPKAPKPDDRFVRERHLKLRPELEATAEGEA